MVEIILSIGLLICYTIYAYILCWSYNYKYEKKIKHLEEDIHFLTEQIKELKSYIYIAK